MTGPPYKPLDAQVIPRFAGIRTYMRAPHVTALVGVDAAIYGIPFDTATSYRTGARFGPEAIRSASALIRPYHPVHDVNVVEALSIVDYGDLPVSPGDTERTYAQVEEGLAPLVAADVFPIALGGDHSITYPIMRAIADKHRAFTILHIDAHGDLYDEFEGDRFSHACPFARIMEERLAARLVQVGIRTRTAHQRAQAERFGVETIDMRAWDAGARPRIVGPVYVTIDLDGLDPSCAPGVSHPEPGGLVTRDVVSLIHAIEGTVVGGDVVELNPARDPLSLTAFVAAKFVKELASRMLSPRS